MDKIIQIFNSNKASLSPESSTMEQETTTGPSASNRRISKDVEELSGLETLPAEIISHILAFLPPIALANLSCASTLLRSHAHNDLLWLTFIRDSVPNASMLDSLSPASSWRHIYSCHHPYWFITRHKIWFADVPNTGKIVLARYNHQDGCIEAHQLIAEHGAHTFESWSHDNDVIIHTFNPKIRLWTDDPVVMLGMEDGNYGKRVQEEIPMHTGSRQGICSMISLCLPIPKVLQDQSMKLWPPSIIPAEQRVRNESGNNFRSNAHRPQRLDLMSDRTFRVRKWLEFSNLMQPLNSVRMGEEVATFSTLLEESYTPTRKKPFQGIWVGDYSGHGCEFLIVRHREPASRITMSRQVSTGSLPEGISIEHMEAETAELHAGRSTEDLGRRAEPEHNCAGTQPYSSETSDRTDSDEDGQNSLAEGEVSGRLEAVKLTGDINVPRGQYTWIAEDIGPKGVIRIANEQMFKGAKMVKSWGHIAGRGFKHDRFIPSQLILISHDCIAQYWVVSLTV